MKFDDGLKEQIKDASDVVDVIGGDIPLHQKGRTYQCCCPFHDDRKPSMTVNRERQTWRCWVCDIGGDVFAYVMRRQNCDFPTALRWLAERAGISIETDKSGPSKKRLLELLEFAASEFHDALTNPNNKAARPARDYAKQRKISIAVAKEFRLGWSPDDWQWLIKRATSNGFTIAELESTGLAKRGEKGVYDMFRNRLLFPITNENGSVVGFGGRELPPSNKGPKYINSPEGPLFSKKRILYGLNRAGQFIKEQKVASVLEGYMDAIACVQAAVENVTAVMGTALTEHHCRLITRYAPKAALVFDGDAAGIKRTSECLPALLSTGLEVCVVEIPDKLDPAEFIERDGGQKFYELVEAAPNAIDYLANKCRENKSTGGKNETLRHVLETLSTCRGDDALLRVEQALVRISRQTGIDKTYLRRHMESIGKGKPATKQPEQPKPQSKSSAPIPRTDIELFWSAFASEEVAGQIVESIDERVLHSESSKQLLELFRELDLQGKAINAQTAMDAAETLELKSLIETATSAEIDVSPKECFDLLQERWHQRNARHRIKESIARIESAESEDEQIQVLQSLLERH